MRKGFNPFFRLLSSFLILAFSCEQLAFAAGDLKPVHISAEGEKLRLAYTIPSSIARVEDSYKAPSSRKTVFLIQDAHTNESGQLNISRTLDLLLSREEGLGTVFAEGAAGNASLSDLRSARPLAEREYLARLYIRKGLLHGAEHLDLTSERRFAIWGVEDPELYTRSLELYRSVARDRDRFELYLKTVRSSYETLSDRLVSPVLKNYLRRSERFMSGELALTEYFEGLSTDAARFGVSLDEYRSLSLLKDLRTRERSIDFVEANKEETQAIASLSPQDRQLLSEIAMKTGASTLQNGMEDPRQGYFLLLEEKLTGHMAEYPELFRYFDYLRAAAGVDAVRVLAEQKELESSLMQAIAASPDEEMFANISRMIRLYEKLFRLTLTPAEYAEYQSLKKDLSLERLTGFLNKKVLDLGTYHERALFLEPGYEDILESCEAFYALTRERDTHFVDVMLGEMDRRGQSKAALVAGGFHTVNLKALLKEKGVSYVSLMPQVMRETNRDRYERILLGQRMAGPVPLSSGALRVSALADSYAKAGAHLPLLAEKSRMLDEFSAQGARLSPGVGKGDTLPDQSGYWRQNPWETNDDHPGREDLLRMEDGIVEDVRLHLAQRGIHKGLVVETMAGKGRLAMKLALLEDVEEIIIVDVNADSLEELRKRERAQRAQVSARKGHMAKVTIIHGDILDAENKTHALLSKAISAGGRKGADVFVTHDALHHLRSSGKYVDLSLNNLAPGGLLRTDLVSWEGNQKVPHFRAARYFHLLSTKEPAAAEWLYEYERNRGQQAFPSARAFWIRVKMWVYGFFEGLGYSPKILFYRFFDKKTGAPLIRSYPLTENELRVTLSDQFHIVRFDPEVIARNHPTGERSYWVLGAVKRDVAGARLAGSRSLSDSIKRLNTASEMVFVQNSVSNERAYLDLELKLSFDAAQNIRSAFDVSSLREANSLIYRGGWLGRLLMNRFLHTEFAGRAEELVEQMEERFLYLVSVVRDEQVLRLAVEILRGDGTLAGTGSLDESSKNLLWKAFEFQQLKRFLDNQGIRDSMTERFVSAIDQRLGAANAAAGARLPRVLTGIVVAFSAVIVWAQTAAAAVVTQVTGSTVTVRPEQGDSIWRIAEKIAERLYGANPTDAQVNGIKDTLLAQNPSITNPDLIFTDRTYTYTAPSPTDASSAATAIDPSYTAPAPTPDPATLAPTPAPAPAPSPAGTEGAFDPSSLIPDPNILFFIAVVAVVLIVLATLYRYRDTIREFFRTTPAGPQTTEVSAEDLKHTIAFGTSGWRASTDKGFTLHNVGRFAQAAADHFKATGFKGRVAVGFDARPTARLYAQRIVEVLVANGIEADLIDQINPTPILVEATRKGADYAAAFQITASHNPLLTAVGSTHYQMGIKMLMNGVPAPDAETGGIAKLANDASRNGTYTWIAYNRISRSVSRRNVDLLTKSNARLDKVFAFKDLSAKLKAAGIKVVLDSMHGGTVFAARVLKKLGVVRKHLRAEPMEEALKSGKIPASVTDPGSGIEVPWRPEPLPFLLKDDLIKETKPGEFGAAFDGDGDRAYMVDRNGRILTPNEIGLIFAHYLHSKGERGVVVRTLPSTNTLDRFAKSKGLRVEETPVGSKWFEPFTTTDDPDKQLLVAVEESGHIFFKYKGEIFADSAVAETFLALEIMAETGLTLTEYLEKIYAEIGELHYERTAVNLKYVTEHFVTRLKLLRSDEKGPFPMDFAKRVAAKTGKKLAAEPLDLRDKSGVKVKFEDGSWLMYRVSGTDGSIRIYAEDTSKEALAKLIASVEEVLVEMTSEAPNPTAKKGEPAPAKTDSKLTPVTPGPVDDYAAVIKRRMGQKLAELEALQKEYLQAVADKDDKRKKEAEDKINKIIDELNVMVLPPGQTAYEDADLAKPTIYLQDFMQMPEYAEYRKQAEQLILAGLYIPQFIFAGAATRLFQDLQKATKRKLKAEDYRMYGLDLWTVVELIQDIAKTEGTEGLLKVLKKEDLEAILAIQVPDKALRVGMGPRQILAYRRLVEETARKNGQDPKAVMAQQRLVMNINEEVAQQILDDFIKNDFYGFKRENVYFIIQPVSEGNVADGGNVKPANGSPELPSGHGEGTTQLTLPKQAFNVMADGGYKLVDESVLDLLAKSDPQNKSIIITHRINDLTKFLTDEVVNLDKLAVNLYLLDKGHNVIVELVGNPGGAKGGNFIKFKDGPGFLIETSNAKGHPHLSGLLDKAGKALEAYNSFRNGMRPGKYAELIKQGLPYNLRFKDGYFYVELVTGDVTQNPNSNTASFEKKGELIHDFKQLTNLREALEYAARQDGVTITKREQAPSKGSGPPAATTSDSPIKSTVITPSAKFGETSARQIADEIRRLQNDPNYIVHIVFATGNTQIPVLAALAKEKGIDWKRVHLWHLDEYDRDEKGRKTEYKDYLTKHIADKVGIPQANRHFVTDYVEAAVKAGQKVSEGLARYTAELKAAGAADIVLLGIGVNGHIGFNEPGTKADSTIGRVQLTQSTIDANKLGPGDHFAYSMGMADILSGKKIFLLANGASKADAVKKSLEGPITEQVPGSLLRKHPNVTAILDYQASSLLSGQARVSEQLVKDLVEDSGKAGRPLVAGFFGKPGSGKGTDATELVRQANDILERRGEKGRVHAISMGDYFRGVDKLREFRDGLGWFERLIWELHLGRGWLLKGSRYEEFKKYLPYFGDVTNEDIEQMKKGEFASDDSVQKIVKRILKDKDHKKAVLLIFDGFPRNMEQLSWITDEKLKIKGKSLKIDIPYIIDVDEATSQAVIESNISRAKEDLAAGLPARPDAPRTADGKAIDEEATRRIALERARVFDLQTQPVIEAVRWMPSVIVLPARTPGVADPKKSIPIRQAAFFQALQNRVAPSTMIPKNIADMLIKAMGIEIREWLAELALYADDPANSPYADIYTEQYKPLWAAVAKWKNLSEQERQKQFSDEALVNTKSPDSPRIEVRGRQPDGTVAQIALVGIPKGKTGNHREPYREALKQMPGADLLHIVDGGSQKIEVNMLGVDKQFAVQYVAQELDMLLDQSGYKPGPKIDARKTRTIRYEDFNKTLAYEDTGDRSPYLADAPTRPELLKYFEMGGLLVIVTGNELERTMHRITHNSPIPSKYYSQIILIANGGSMLGVINPDGTFREITDYRLRGLRKRTEWKKVTVDAEYGGDDPRGNDDMAIRELGKNRFINVSDESIDKQPEGLKDNYVGFNEVGMAAYFQAVNEYLRESAPNSNVFTPSNIRKFVARARQILIEQGIAKPDSFRKVNPNRWIRIWDSAATSGVLMVFTAGTVFVGAAVFLLFLGVSLKLTILVLTVTLAQAGAFTFLLAPLAEKARSGSAASLIDFVRLLGAGVVILTVVFAPIFLGVELLPYVVAVTAAALTVWTGLTGFFQIAKDRTPTVRSGLQLIAGSVVLPAALLVTFPMEAWVTGLVLLAAAVPFLMGLMQVYRGLVPERFSEAVVGLLSSNRTAGALNILSVVAIILFGFTVVQSAILSAFLVVVPVIFLSYLGLKAKGWQTKSLMLFAALASFIGGSFLMAVSFELLAASAALVLSALAVMAFLSGLYQLANDSAPSGWSFASLLAGNSIILYFAIAAGSWIPYALAILATVGYVWAMFSQFSSIMNAPAKKSAKSARLAGQPSRKMSAEDIQREMQDARPVSKQLHTPLDPKSKHAANFPKGGYKKPGYGVSAGASVDGNFAIDDEGDQGYFVNGGKEKFMAIYKSMKEFFERRKAVNGGKPIRYILKLGIGGQHTPFEGIASAFQVIDTKTGKIVGEYELGKDYEASMKAALKSLGIGWDQVAVIPSSKSGSTDETMMIFVEVLYVMLKNVAGKEKGVAGEAFAEAVLDTLHQVNFKDGKERPGAELFKMDAERFGDMTLLDLVAKNTGLSVEQVTKIFGKVLGNMFFETTDKPEESRLSAFIRNSGLDKQLGENAPGFGAMFENVGGRWTADLHMLTFLAYHGLDAEKYWEIRNAQVRALRAEKGLGFELGNRILNDGITDIALVVPDQLLWWGKSIEQNFNESIWQDGFANLVAIPESKWKAHKKYYNKAGGPGRLVINLTNTKISDAEFDVAAIGDFGLSRVGSDKQKLAGILAELSSTLYAVTHTIGNRLIARAIRRAGLDPATLDINDLDNAATKVLQENLYVRQPYVELGKGLLEEQLNALQAQGPEAIRAAYQKLLAEARQTDAGGKQAVEAAMLEAKRKADAEGKKLVVIFYLHGQLFINLRDASIAAGVPWVMQGTGDQHISIQQVLAQPKKYHLVMVDFVSETPQPGRPAVGFAKGYLHNVSPNLVRSLFSAEGTFKALTQLRKDQGGQGTFLRLTESKANARTVLNAVKKAQTSGARLAQANVLGVKRTFETFFATAHPSDSLMVIYGNNTYYNEQDWGDLERQMQASGASWFTVEQTVMPRGMDQDNLLIITPLGARLSLMSASVTVSGAELARAKEAGVLELDNGHRITASDVNMIAKKGSTRTLSVSNFDGAKSFASMYAELDMVGRFKGDPLMPSDQLTVFYRPPAANLAAGGTAVIINLFAFKALSAFAIPADAILMGVLVALALFWVWHSKVYRRPVAPLVGLAGTAGILYLLNIAFGLPGLQELIGLYTGATTALSASTLLQVLAASLLSRAAFSWLRRLSAPSLSDTALQEGARLASGEQKDYFKMLEEFMIRSDGKNGDELREMFEQVLREVFPQLFGGVDFSKPPVDVQDPDEMRRRFDRPLPEKGQPLEVVLKRYREEVAKFSTDWKDPRLGAAHFVSQSFAVAVFADLLIGALNQNQIAYDAAPATTYAELETIRWLNEIIGYDTSRAGGSIVSGGTTANETALLVARNRAIHRRFEQIIADPLLRARFEQVVGKKAVIDNIPDVTAVGLPEVVRILKAIDPKFSGRFVILANKEAHYSHKKIGGFIGIGSDNVITRTTFGRDSVDELEDQIAQHHAAGDLILAVIATAGTSEEGRVDPLSRIIATAQRHGIWAHVDAAHGGALKLSHKPEHKDLVRGMEKADSVTLDPHKWFYLPFGIGAILFKDRGNMDYVKSSARYAFPEGENLHLGSHTLQGSKRFEALKLWLMLQVVGTENVGRIVDHTIDETKKIADWIKTTDEFELISEPVTNILTFRFVPGHLRARLEDARKRGDRDELERLNGVLNELNLKIYEKLVQTGYWYFSQTELKYTRYYTEDESYPASREVVVMRNVNMNPYVTLDGLIEIYEHTARVGYEIAAEAGLGEEKRAMTGARLAAPTATIKVKDLREQIRPGFWQADSITVDGQEIPIRRIWNVRFRYDAQDKNKYILIRIFTTIWGLIDSLETAYGRPLEDDDVVEIQYAGARLAKVVTRSTARERIQTFVTNAKGGKADMNILGQSFDIPKADDERGGVISQAQALLRQSEGAMFTVVERRDSLTITEAEGGGTTNLIVALVGILLAGSSVAQWLGLGGMAFAASFWTVTALVMLPVFLLHVFVLRYSLRDALIGTTVSLVSVTALGALGVLQVSLLGLYQAGAVALGVPGLLQLVLAAVASYSLFWALLQFSTYPLFRTGGEPAAQGSRLSATLPVTDQALFLNGTTAAKESARATALLSNANFLQRAAPAGRQGPSGSAGGVVLGGAGESVNFSGARLALSRADRIARIGNLQSGLSLRLLSQALEQPADQRGLFLGNALFDQTGTQAEQELSFVIWEDFSQAVFLDLDGYNVSDLVALLDDDITPGVLLRAARANASSERTRGVLMMVSNLQTLLRRDTATQRLVFRAAVRLYNDPTIPINGALIDYPEGVSDKAKSDSHDLLVHFRDLGALKTMLPGHPPLVQLEAELAKSSDFEGITGARLADTDHLLLTGSVQDPSLADRLRASLVSLARPITQEAGARLSGSPLTATTARDSGTPAAVTMSMIDHFLVGTALAAGARLTKDEESLALLTDKLEIYGLRITQQGGRKFLNVRVGEEVRLLDIEEVKRAGSDAAQARLAIGEFMMARNQRRQADANALASLTDLMTAKNVLFIVDPALLGEIGVDARFDILAGEALEFAAKNPGFRIRLATSNPVVLENAARRLAELETQLGIPGKISTLFDLERSDAYAEYERVHLKAVGTDPTPDERQVVLETDGLSGFRLDMAHFVGQADRQTLRDPGFVAVYSSNMDRTFRADSGELDSVIWGRADLGLRRRYALLPVIPVDFGDLFVVARNMLQIGRSA